MNELMIISIIAFLAIVAGIVIVWRQQIKLVREAEWMNKNRTKQTPQKNIERQLYESDLVEIDQQKIHRISGSDIHIATKNYIRRMNKDKLITWTTK
jgi:uncharacterized protein HemX